MWWWRLASQVVTLCRSSVITFQGSLGRVPSSGTCSSPLLAHGSGAHCLWSRQPDAGCRVQAAALGPGSRTLGAESRQLPLVQAARRWVRSQAHSRVKALPSGPLQALAWLCCSGCGFCSWLLFSTCGLCFKLISLVWDCLTSLWSKMTPEVLPAHPVLSP